MKAAPGGWRHTVIKARVWALLYSRTGDNNQALALANSLSLPFESKRLNYNWLRGAGLHLGPSFLTLDAASRRQLGPPWPDVIVAIGRWSVPVARAIKVRSKGKTKIIFLGNPRVDPKHFDLIIATRDYLFPRGDNVVVAPLPVAMTVKPTERDSLEPDWCVGLPHPRTLLLIGGSVKYWMLSKGALRDAVLRLVRTANKRGGSIVVSGSPRTPDELIDVARDALAEAEHGQLAPSRTGGLGGLLNVADEIMVTGDSMSMVTEAILSGKPVGLLPLQLSSKGLRKLGPIFAREGSTSKRRDLRRFWSELWSRNLAGTFSEPKATAVESSATAVARFALIFLGLAQLPGNVQPVAGTMAHQSIPVSEALPIERGRAAFASLRDMTYRSQLWLGQSTERLIDLTRRYVGALWLAVRDRQTPWYAKLVAGIASAFAISPIDLTPDALSEIGHFDDPILLFLGTLVAIRLVPRPLMNELRNRAAVGDCATATNGTFAILSLWVTAGLHFARVLY